MKKLKHSCFFLPFLFLLHCISSYAQEARLKFQRFGVDQGLTVTTAFSIVQDENGFLWISTIDGLLRYDGYRFTNYKNNFKDSTSLSDNTLSTIFQDKKGLFWVGTYNEGVNCFNPRTAKAKHYRNVPGNEQSLSNNRVWCCCEDDKGMIWVGTDHGLNILDPSTGKIKRLFHSDSDPASISSDRILCLGKDGKGKIWIGTDHGLNSAETEGSGTTFKRYLHDPLYSASLSDNIVLSIYYSMDHLWVGTVNGLNRLNGESGSFQHYSFMLESVGKSKEKNEDAEMVYSYLNSYGENSVRSVIQISEKELWVATDKGVKVLDPTTGAYASYYSDQYDPTTLSADLCLCFCKERSGNIWIGTMIGGISKTDLKPKKFPLIQTGFGNPYNLSKDNIRSVFMDHTGTLWVGTLGGGLNRIDEVSGKFVRVRENDKDQGLRFDPENVWAISEDLKGKMWFGTSNGLWSFDPFTNSFRHFGHDPNDPHSISSDIVRCILPYDNEKIWVGTENGLNNYDAAQGTFTSYHNDKNDPKSISNNTIWTIRNIRGDFWIGTDDGLNRIMYDPMHAIVFNRYNTEENNEKSLSNKSVRSIYEALDGMIWIGTNNGLNSFDPVKNEFTRYSEADGLPNSFVYAVLGDEKGNLWISTNYGISRFNVKEKKFRNYDKMDGLQNNEFNTGAYFKAQHGTLYFGGPEGLNFFRPDHVMDNRTPPPVVITAIKLFGEDLKTEMEAPNIRELTFRYDQNVIAFEFAALDFTEPGKNRYAYQLIGFDPVQINSGNLRFVNYTNLDPGEYTFKVFACNNDGIWNNEGASIHITIIPPFWKTWWFSTLCALTLVLSVYGLFRYRLSRLRQVQSYLEYQVNKKTKELRDEKEVVESQKKTIEKKNHSITSSIHYARRIQDSILPMKEKINGLLPNSFILFKPKDIVSGDFYWFTQQGNNVLVAAVDCTGHGVPGAFMSLIGNNLLNNIVGNKKVSDPKLILEKLHDGVVRSLKKDEQESGTVDGMDISLCSINLEKNSLDYAATGRPLLLIRNGEIKKYKNGRHPVGLVTEKDPGFEKEHITLQPGDTFYIYTDGYCDQFGGADDDKYMEVNFEKLLLRINGMPMPEQAAALEKEIAAWKGDRPQLDDILVIGIRI